MKYYAKIVEETVVQVIVATPKDFESMSLNGEWVECLESTSVADKYKNGLFTRTENEVEVIDESVLQRQELEVWRKSTSLSRRRFKIGEALYMVDDEPLKAKIATLLENLEEPQKTIATIAYQESGTFDRLDPFVVQFSQALGMSDEDTDAFFNYCLNEEWNNE